MWVEALRRFEATKQNISLTIELRTNNFQYSFIQNSTLFQTLSYNCSILFKINKLTFKSLVRFHLRKKYMRYEILPLKSYIFYTNTTIVQPTHNLGVIQTCVVSDSPCVRNTYFSYLNTSLSQLFTLTSIAPSNFDYSLIICHHVLKPRSTYLFCYFSIICVLCYICHIIFIKVPTCSAIDFHLFKYTYHFPNYLRIYNRLNCY